MAARNSSGAARRRIRPGGNRPRTHPKKPSRNTPKPRRKPASNPDTIAILGKLEDGLALSQTAYAALIQAIDGSPVEPPDLGQIATTLDHGLAILISAISETDVALGTLKRRNTA